MCIKLNSGVFPRLSASSRIAHLLPEEQVYLNQQSGTIRLDCFTHCLIVKCAPDITVSPVSLYSLSLNFLHKTQNAATFFFFFSFNFLLFDIFWSSLSVGVLC